MWTGFRWAGIDADHSLLMILEVDEPVDASPGQDSPLILAFI